MPKKSFHCPAEMTLSLIDGKWRVIVLWLLRKGPQRSGKLKNRLPGISAAAFSNSVRGLEADGLVRRTVKGGPVAQVSYALTARGESLGPIVKSLVKWGLTNQEIYGAGEFLMAGYYRAKNAGAPR